MKKENVYFDTGAYSNGSGSLREDLISLTIENAEASLDQRITPYELAFDANGDLGFKLRWETETDKLENQALFSVRDLAKEGKGNTIWISPPSDEIGYKESRVVVSILKEKKDDGALIFECRGLCSKFNGDEWLKIVEKFGYSFDDSEVLRGMAIPFEVGEDGDWIKALEEKIYMPEVWKTIREGSDLLNKKKKEEIIDKVINIFGDDLKKEKTHRQSLYLGSEIEHFLSQNGVNLQSSGSCGISNTEALKGSFDVLFDSSLNPGTRPEGYDYYCSVCGCWCKDRTCPICNKSLSAAA